MSVDDSIAFQAWMRQQKAAEKMRKELARLKKEGNEAGAAMAAGATAAAKAILAGVGAIAGIGGAVAALQAVAAQVQREVANIRSRQTEAGATQIDSGRVLAQAVDNLNNVMDSGKFRQLMLGKAQKANIPFAEMTTMVGASMAAVGPSSEAEVAKIADLAPKIAEAFPHLSTEDAGLGAGAISSLSLKAGLSDEEAIGLFKQLAGVHRSSTTEMLVKNALPGIPQLMNLGHTPGTASALMGSMSQQMEDLRGAESTTAAVNVSKNLAQRYPEMKTFEERLAKVQGDPHEQRKYLHGGVYSGVGKMPAASMEQGAYTTIKNLIEGKNQDTLQALPNVMKGVGGKEQWQSAYDMNKAQLAKLPEVQQLKLQKAFQGATSGIQLERMAEGTSGVVVDEMEKTLKAGGMSDLSQRISNLKTDVKLFVDGKVSTQSAVEAIRKHAGELEAPLGFEGYVAGGMNQVPQYLPSPKNATQEGLATAARERALADYLEGQDTILKDTQFGSIVGGAESKIADIKTLRSEIEADQDFTPADAKAARSRMEQASLATRGLQAEVASNPSRGSDQTRTLIEENRRTQEALNKLINSLEKNTKSTDANSGTGGASGVKPPPPKNSQASRRLDRRSGGAYGGGFV